MPGPKVGSEECIRVCTCCWDSTARLGLICLSCGRKAISAWESCVFGEMGFQLFECIFCLLCLLYITVSLAVLFLGGSRWVLQQRRNQRQTVYRNLLAPKIHEPVLFFYVGCGYLRTASILLTCSFKRPRLIQCPFSPRKYFGARYGLCRAIIPGDVFDIMPDQVSEPQVGGQHVLELVNQLLQFLVLICHQMLSVLHLFAT